MNSVERHEDSMEYIVHGYKNQIDSRFFTYFGAISLKRMRRFDLLTTDLGHALVVSDLTQIPAQGSGCIVTANALFLLTAAHRVAQTTPYDAEVKMKLMTPPMSAPVVPEPFEENLVLVSGLSPECAGVDLTDFFSAPNARNEIQRVTFSSQPGVAMLQFGQPLTGR